jgi:hypothetical protein
VRNLDTYGSICTRIFLAKNSSRVVCTRYAVYHDGEFLGVPTDTDGHATTTRSDVGDKVEESGCD